MKSDYHTIQSYPVRLQDCDPAGKIHLHRLMDYAQDADDLNCRLLGVNDQALREKNACWIILANSFHFAGDFPRPGETLIVDTWSQGMKGIRFFRKNLYYVNKISDDHLLGESTSEWIICAADSHRPIRPQSAIDLVSFLEASDNETVNLQIPEPLKPVQAFAGQPCLFSHQAGYSDMDLNTHMHNTHYARLAVDAAAKIIGLDPWTGKLLIRSFHIKYRSETGFNDTLSLYASLSPRKNQVDVAGYAGENNSFLARLEYEVVKQKQ